MNANKAAPVACTLSAIDFKARAQWLSELTLKGLMAYRIEGPSVHLTYKPEVAEEVEMLVRQEQCCCSFLQFRITRTSDYVELTITAPAKTGDDALALFAHLVPS
jgi:hypothetical protein